MKKLLVLGAVAVMGLTACNKNQKVVNNMNGEWKIARYTVNGTNTDISFFEGFVYSFEDCKLKADDCMAYAKFEGTVIDTMYYIVAEKGTLFISVDAAGVAQDTSNIVEASKSTIIISSEEGEDKTEMELSKI